MMTQKTANMVSEWVKMDGGDVERTAKWMAYTLKLGNITRMPRDDS